MSDGEPKYICEECRCVPGAVAVVIRLIQARPELVSVLRQIAPLDEAVRDRRGRKMGSARVID